LTLSWRIPTAGDPRLLRLALAQIGLASVVAGLVLATTMPAEWLAPALAGLVPLAIFMAYRRWKRYQDSMAGEDNVRLDETGLRWLHGSGQEQSFRRDDVTSFHIGASRETLRPVPALTLHLKGGFESQPIELHPPATTDAVRAALSDQWRIPESEPARENSYDVRVEVFSECHSEFQEWHWEGTRDELARFFKLIATAAHELPPPPPGAKPAKRIILANRRHPTRVTIAHSPAAHFDEDHIAAPASVLAQIAASARDVLGKADEHDPKFDVELGPRNRWTFHLHVREP
jgi:hypothetical protein